jgi:hypothetical protein
MREAAEQIAEALERIRIGPRVGGLLPDERLGFFRNDGILNA